MKDSGERAEFAGGMVRDVESGKLDYTLIVDGPMFERWAEHLTKGAQKYEARNWMKATGDAELQRFKRSAFRHFMQWYRGDRDEDHAAGVYFNINGYEYVLAQEYLNPVYESPVELAERIAELEYQTDLQDQDNMYLMDRINELSQDNALLSHDLMEARLKANAPDPWSEKQAPGEDASW